MSYDISLLDPVSREVIELDHNHHMRGGTYQVGGSNELSLNITYNYSKHYARVFPVVEKGDGSDWEQMFGGGRGEGIRTLYGKTGAESIPILESAIAQLSDETSKDYWEPTEGNAKKALIQLLTMAKMRPDGIWDGD